MKGLHCLGWLPQIQHACRSFHPQQTKSFVADTMVTLCSGAHRHLVLTLLMDKVRNHRDADHLAMAALKCTTWQKKVPESLRVANLPRATLEY
jgi:hypothetical protein